MKIFPKDLLATDACGPDEIADFWVELAEASNTDPEAKAFLTMFEPWAKARIGSPS